MPKEKKQKKPKKKQIENYDLDFLFTTRQQRAFNTLDKPEVLDLMYGGAKGGGKSVFFCIWVYLFCYQIVNDFDLKISKNPPHIGWMGRKQSVDFTGTTLETWKEWIPEHEYDIKGGTEKSSRHILLWNRVAVDFGGLDRSEHINKFNSAEYAFIAIDQAEETTKDEISVLRASRRLKIKGKHLPYKGLFTANPAKCWLKDEFLTSPRENYRFVQALPSDNPHLPGSYVQMLTQAFSHRPELLAAYLKGSWDIADDACQLIKTPDLMLAYDKDRLRWNNNPRHLLTCDVARYGDDETVIYYMHETDIKDEWIYGQKNTMHTAGMLAKLSREREDCLVVLDEGGVGGGVVDRLEELGVPVLAIDGGKKATDLDDMGQPKYFNKRAEVWDNAARMFAEEEVELHNLDETFKAQLTTPTYEYRNSRILIEAKKKMKERIGRSPDRADAYVNGLYGLRDATNLNSPLNQDRGVDYASLGVG